MPHSLRCLAPAFASALWLASAARASEQVPAQIAPEDDSIAAVKRDLQELKSNANNDAARPPPATAPSSAMPQFHALEEPVSIAKPQRGDGNATQPQPSAYWLVDAMMKPKPDRASDRRRDSLDPRTRRDDDLLGRRPGNGERQSSDERESASDQQQQSTGRPNETFNPLDRYMADWLTPQDYTLLKKTSAVAAEANGDAPSSAPLPAGFGLGRDQGAALSGFGLDQLAGDQETGALAKPVENPYLQAFPVPETSAQPVPSAPAASLPATPSFAPPPMPEPATTKPTLPDFVKPATDDKYFKPLKRF